MSQQSRRLRDGERAERTAKTLRPLEGMSLEELEKISERLWDGVGALQSTDYVGDRKEQAIVNKRHDDLVAEAKRLDQEIERRRSS